MTKTLQQHPFLRILIPFAFGVFCGDALFFQQRAVGCLESASDASMVVVPSALLSIASELLAIISALSPTWIYLVIFLFILAAHLLSKLFQLQYLRGISVLVCFFVLGVSLSVERLQRTNFPFSDKEDVYQVLVSEKPEMKERSILCSARLEGRVDPEATSAPRGNHTVLLYLQKDSAAAALRRGDRLWIYARPTPPANNGNPEEFDYVRYLTRKGGSATAYVPAHHWRVIGHDASRTLRQAALDCREEVVALYRRLGFRGDNLAVLSALTVGDKENLSDDIQETYSITGASHVLALSGLHIGFLYALLHFFISYIWRRWALFKPFGLLIIIVLLWAFAFITGLSSSVVRSVIMCSLVAVSCLQIERPLSINTLSATAFLMLVYNPLWLFDVGFQLSFVAVSALLLIQPRLYRLLNPDSRPLRYVWGLLTVSVAAQIGTAPLVIFYFSRFSTHFLLTNLWVIPMVTLILYSAVLMLVFTPLPVVQRLLAMLVDALLDAQNGVLRWIERLPASSIDGMWVDAWIIILFYIALLLMFRCFKVTTVRNVYLALCGILALVSYNAYTTFASVPQRSVNFYNVRSCPAVHCVASRGQSWLICADSVPDVSRLHRSLSRYWNHQRLHAPQTVTEDCFTPSFSFHDDIVCYAGKIICMIHSDNWRYKESSQPLNVDYLYISRGYNGDISELASLLNIKRVILDSSLSDYRSNIIKDDCHRLTIPCISIKDRGALQIRLY